MKGYYKNHTTGFWHYDFVIKGVRKTGACKDRYGAFVTTERRAKEITDELRKDIRKELLEGAAALRSLSFAQVALDFTDRAKTYRSWRSIKAHVTELLDYFGSDTKVETIDEASIERYIAWALTQPTQVYSGGSKSPARRKQLDEHMRSGGKTRSPSTVNRYLMTLSSILKRALTYIDPATRQPLYARVPRVKKLREPVHIPNPISEADINRIIAKARSMGFEHIADAVIIARHTGLRYDEVFLLSRDHIDIEGRFLRLSADETKADREERIHLNDTAFSIISRLHERAKSLGQDRLILWRRGAKGTYQPCNRPKRSWQKVLDELQLKHRFHDLKASFVSEVGRHASAHIVQKLARHKDFTTTLRYLSISDETLIAAIRSVANPAHIDGETLAEAARPEAESRPTAAPTAALQKVKKAPATRAARKKSHKKSHSEILEGSDG